MYRSLKGTRSLNSIDKPLYNGQGLPLSASPRCPEGLAQFAAITTRTEPRKNRARDSRQSCLSTQSAV